MFWNQYGTKHCEGHCVFKCYVMLDESNWYFCDDITDTKIGNKKYKVILIKVDDFPQSCLQKSTVDFH